MLRDTSPLSLEEPGIGPATFRLPVDQLSLLSHMPPPKSCASTTEVYKWIGSTSQPVYGPALDLELQNNTVWVGPDQAATVCLQPCTSSEV